MAFRRAQWTRVVFDQIPIYILPDAPEWFVPNAAADRLLQRLGEEHSEERNENTLSPADARFLARLPEALSSRPAYPGRSAFLETDTLHELWFHVTDRCDLACKHCLFACGPQEAPEMPADRILSLASEAHSLGTRVFALTGGEPFVHRECDRVIEGLLELPETNLVILTNGLSLRNHAQIFARLPRGRVHLQISVAGLERSHDRLRGKHAYARLREQLDWLRESGWPFTVSTCVDRGNLHEMVDLVDNAANLGASALHFMWYFIRGRGKKAGAPDTGLLARHLIDACQRAEERGIGIDNLDAVRARVFSPPGTKYDGSSSGWQSLAVAPDGRLYPSPALIGLEELATRIDTDLADAWRTSEVLERLRKTSVKDDPSPMRFLLGGGDSDHSFVHAGTFTGDDPYLPMYETLSQWVITQQARRQPETGPPRLRAKMGDLLETCDVAGEVALTHSNCVLSLTSEDGTTSVARFYSEAAEQTKEDILNPVCYGEEAIAHIPPEGRVRSYGCGSPVLDAGLSPGEAVVDLGSGTGVECFIAARQVGSLGQVTGIDMLDPMLAKANQTAEGVRRNLGYNNLQFLKGLLEELPLKDTSTDVVLSNCVLNLSHDKRRTFSEIVRILRPGGRLVVSDVVCETDPGPSIRNDEVLLGECLGGALTQRDLFGLLDEAGLTGAMVIKRFPYRRVRGHDFFSMTFQAHKPAARSRVRAMYRGPWPALIAEDGTLLPAGESVSLMQDQAVALEGQVFLFDGNGAITNLAIGESSCCSTDATPPGEGSCCETGENPAATGSCCETPPEETVGVGPRPTRTLPLLPTSPTPIRERVGCMICGLELKYLPEEMELTCDFCSGEFSSAMVCPDGHFVCDRCHARDARAVMEAACLASEQTDMIEILHEIRSHPSFSIHGPEHHALVPGVILAACRNAGASISDEQILKGIRRGSKIPGGACGYLGICGAAAGVGAAFAIILESTPRKGSERQIVMKCVGRALERIAEFEAARCCQRDCYVALRAAAEMALEFTGASPRAEIDLRCNQIEKNPDCVGQTCPLHPGFSS